MLQSVPTSGVNRRVPHGEFAIIRAISDAPGTAYSYSAYAVRTGQYILSDGTLSATEVTYAVQVDTLPDGNELVSVYVDPSNLTRDDLVLVTVTNDADALDTYDYYIEVGSYVVTSDDLTVEVYGYLRDALGKSIRDMMVTFTVSNSSTYFDSAPRTTLNASVLTDDNGRFTIHLNKNYKYVLSIKELGYLKMVDLTTLPAGTTVVEVDLGAAVGG